MPKVVSVDTMRQVEAAADASGLSYATLMDNAGRAITSRVLELIQDRSDARITVLVGSGNNGGDGLVAGRLIAEQSMALVRFYLLKERDLDDVNFKAVHDARLFVAYASHDRDGRLLRNLVASSDVLIDALFGIGVRLPLRDDAARVLRLARRAVNSDTELLHHQDALIDPTHPHPIRPARPTIIAVDCPSGLNCDTGELDQQALWADETITFIAAKPGLFEFPGAAAVGRLWLATCGVPADLPELKGELSTLVDGAMAADLLPARSANANKGTFGKALIVAGSGNYVGAAVLSGMAAYRSGVGLVTIAAPPLVVQALSSQWLEPTWICLPGADDHVTEEAATSVESEITRYDSLVIGPGWGQHDATRTFLTRLLTQLTPDSPVKMVIDADALNLLSSIPDWHKLLPRQVVLTPHPGEMARLVGGSVADVMRDRSSLVQEKTDEWNVTLVLKGAHTLIGSPDGRIAVLPFKNDALATAGTGDVLAGLIGGFMAQGLMPYDAAVLGGYVHGLAGEQAAAQQGNSRSVIASDVLQHIGAALTSLTNRHS